ncbi:MAG: RNA-binding domain-containing protein [Thermoanaerobaculia bacterium]
MVQIVDRALAARRQSRGIEFKRSFDAASDRDWCNLIKDIVALANSGGGVILFGVDKSGAPDGTEVSPLLNIDPATISDRIHAVTGAHFEDFQIVEADKDAHRLALLLVGEADAPMVFSRSGMCGFAEGTLYFRHGSKSEPATTQDVEEALNRRVNALRRSWLTAVRRVTAPAGGGVVLPPEIRDSDSPDATPIRIVEDARAPAFRLVDYDKTHPFRQKEVLAALHARVPSVPINQFDLLSVRHVHNTDAVAEYSHKPVFGTRQYSRKFIDWLVGQVERDPGFFTRAREQYMRSRSSAAGS